MLKNIIEIALSPQSLFIVSALLLIINSIQKNNNFFDVRDVIKSQYNLFKGNKFQVIIFFIVPFLLSLGVVQIKYINKDIINNINIVLSIFISMFFAMLSILGGMSKSNKEQYNILLKETFNTIIFECILCIIILIVSFIRLFLDSYEHTISLMGISIFIYYLIFVVVLNIFLVIKRLKILFDERV
ncbi:hypothetical protein DMN26_01275 [Clostridium perfringens]|uniref:hypothetical protein n=1 Tax=Clostridium perfringens TaxID=1502 RepID=UPI001CB4261A|nr:hypothetical protein [Clostridium perfringens]MDM0671864.1 hypothetical protein [Clostridium perfringens]HBI6978432.1 hypothetical protein [Clostridium perfringens]HBI7001444.1 hypothetical protein [Clostridium perfringens]